MSFAERVSSARVALRACSALICAGVVLMLGAHTAAAVEGHPHVGKLPGFPSVRGLIPALGSPAAVSAHEQLVKGAFDAARVHAEHRFVEGEPNELLQAGCGEELLFYYTQDVCYQGGPVLRDPTVHLIFWQGQPGAAGETKVGNFPKGPGESTEGPGSYIGIVEQYFTDVAHDSGLETNVFAVDRQYGDELEPGRYEPGVYASTFDKATDVYVDKSPFPVLSGKASEECSDFVAKVAEGPCVLDKGIQGEVETVAAKQGWSTGLKTLFFVFTAPGVGSCEREGCAYEQYCAYHGDFGGEGIYPPGNQTIYANMPFGGVQGCDPGVHPNSKVDDGADAVIDAAGHEFNESITDPLGSQCKTGAKQDRSERTK